MSVIGHYLIIFFISMVPIIELRGAIPYAVGFIESGVPLSLPLCYVIAVVGNMVPVPFIFFLARKVLDWGKDKKIIGRPCRFFLNKGHNAGQKLQDKAGRGLFVALLLFVGIPLPGTGAWTGALVAAMLDMRLKRAFPAIALGVLAAGIIVAFVTCGADALFF